MDTQQKHINILVIRSATRILNQTLKAVKKEFPESRITLLTQNDGDEKGSRNPVIDDVVKADPRHRMSVFNFGWSNLRKLRKRKFSLAIVLYNVDHGLGYSNIDLLAWSSKAVGLRGYNSTGNYENLTGKKILKKWLSEKTSLFWVGLNFLSTSILFALITLGLLGEWCARKIAAFFKPSGKTYPGQVESIPTASPHPARVSKAMTRV